MHRVASPAALSKGLLLQARAGTAVLHHGDIKHAGDRIESGERLQLVAFFYGNERRGNSLPLATDHAKHELGSAPPTAVHAPRAATGATGPRPPSALSHQY